MTAYKLNGKHYIYVYINISSVVEFQRWWVLKSKLFAQESICSKEIFIQTSSNYFKSLVLLLISNLINGLRLHQCLGTKATEANKSLKTDPNGAH